MPYRRSFAKQIVAFCVIGFGGALAAIAYGYPQGSLVRPGPGFLPFYIGLFMVLLGGFIVAENHRQIAETKAEDTPGNLRAVVAISAAIVILALLLERLGFIPAVVAMFLCIGFAERGQNWLVLMGVCAFMLVFGVVLFIWGLGVPIPVIGAS